ncbi:MAG: response regulator, partial [Psychrobacter glacincola]
KVLQRHLHTIKGGALMAGIRSIGDLTHEAESVYEAFVESKREPTAQWLEIMQVVQDTLSLQVAHIVRYQKSFFAPELMAQLQQFLKAQALPETVQLIVPMPNNHVAAAPQIFANQDAQHVANVADTLSLDRIIQQSWADGLPDPDVLEVFLEEAAAFTNGNECLQLFLNDVGDMVALQALQRDLHTLKGGARMVTATGIADLAHEMESVYQDFVAQRRPVTKKVLELLVACYDWLADAVFILSQQVNPPTPSLLIEALQQFSENPDSLEQIPTETLQAERETISIAKEKQQATYIQKDISAMPLMANNTTEQEQNANNNEMIRISGGLIEHMINLSGESAINRARIDMGISSLTNSIEEMGTTVQRLADQLRRMEIELEAQILSQIDEELVNHEGFDPLEMDQYSSLNQLSKSLTESASDLVDINHTLLEKTRDSESLLLQLSRTQTELQDGLMNSRMVPFTRLTPRLERIVRQTANELNKSVELKIINADDEMDRTILERITSPLEHMLRNAVDHGIENVAARLAAGKERSGQITLEVLREGSEIVILLNDDGQGIDVEAVREKAISQGLIDANDSNLSDLDIMQYIFNAGLSTSKQVTQISGRGVGMDVVISEIRQLGGAVSVVSELGKGSSFTIRVPLTVAVSDALVVRAADRYYAIPLVQIERVVRINPEKVYDYYQSGEATLNFEDTDYRVRYLNEILSGNKLNELVVNTNTSVPLIIIKNRSGQNMALQVDQIAGSRIEVVVKPLGQQFSNLSGISAATIMGDGSVMLILDLIALMRNAALVKDVTHSKVTKQRNVESNTTILVVDDSVTVRKVTSRFLERQGFNVVLAKDGIDALEILQEMTPDLMLLDIEMPRMDGFEVATQVRDNGRLQHLPIIMITSRTGEKHRERALEIGVNDYMGKPFQENQLLDKIQSLLDEKVHLTYHG